MYYYLICKHIFVDNILNESELIFSTQLNGFKYCYIIVAI